MSASRPSPAPSSDRVSVCISVHHEARFLREAADSIRAQSRAVHEIIVCNDTSNGVTTEITGLTEASGELVALYRAGDVYHPNIVERQADYLADHPEAGAVICLGNFIDQSGRVVGRNELSADLVGRTSFDCGEFTEAVLTSEHIFADAPLMFRRETLDTFLRCDNVTLGPEAGLDLLLGLSSLARIGLVPEYLFDTRRYPASSSDRQGLRTTQKPFFKVVDYHLSRPGVRTSVSKKALTRYDLSKVQDEAQCAANALILGDRTRARALLNTSLVRPLLRSSLRLPAARVLAKKLILRAAVAAGAGPIVRNGVYAATFRRRLPRNVHAEPIGIDPTVIAADSRKSGGAGRAAAREKLAVYLDPFSYHFFGNALFDPVSKFNRDSSLGQWIALRERVAKRGVSLNTADYLTDGHRRASVNVYVSFGVHDRYQSLSMRDDVLMNSFYLFETMLYDAAMYRKLPDLSRRFRNVYSWTDEPTLAPFAEGEFRVKSFRFPMPFNAVIEKHWSRTDRRGIVLVNSNRPGVSMKGDLLTERLRALRHFADRGGIDLWGRWWDTIHSTDQPFADAIRKSWRGPVVDKYELYSKAAFVVCYENMAMRGWITEKIFDCFYSGAVPIYLGAPDITDWVPRECFVDARDFKSYDEMSRFLESLGPDEMTRYRQAAREYLASERFRPFTAEAFADRFISDIDSQLAEHGLPELSA